MNLLTYLVASLLVLAALVPTSSSALLPPLGRVEGKPDDPKKLAGCTVLRWKREATTFPKMFIRDPGKYCLDRDYTMRGCTHSCYGHFIDIDANDVEVDLRGHSLTSNHAAFSGIQALGSNITIRNGRIRGPGSGVRLRASSPAGSHNVLSPSSFDIANDRRPSDPIAVFGSGGARLENLVIETDQEPIAAAGANVAVIGNIIRAALSPEDKAMVEHRRMFPDSPRRFVGTSPFAMISVYGPGSVVEGNTIEQTNRTDGQVTAYSILLRDAKGAVVRNNRIRNSGTSRSTVAVGLKDSIDVVLGGNIFLNIETPAVSIGAGSTFVQRP